ncbi:MAG: pseudouridine synthase [Candidatus Woesearchaeota archaeon]
MQGRIQKIISTSGFCSRRKAEELIAEGRVAVNGRTADIGDSADSKKDEITIDDIPIEKGTRKLYILVHKPKGYVSTTASSEGKNVLDLVPFEERLFPVGRLDKDASGLVILTNDGLFANRVMHPSNKVEKKYFVKLNGFFDKKLKAEIYNGVQLRDCVVKGRVLVLSKNTLFLTIVQGQNKVVKRLFSKLGFRVVQLARTQIGDAKLDVKSGKWRHLKHYEISGLMNAQGEKEKNRKEKPRRKV